MWHRARDMAPSTPPRRGQHVRFEPWFKGKFSLLSPWMLAEQRSANLQSKGCCAQNKRFCHQVWPCASRVSSKPSIMFFLFRVQEHMRSSKQKRLPALGLMAETATHISFSQPGAFCAPVSDNVEVTRLLMECWSSSVRSHIRFSSTWAHFTTIFLLDKYSRIGVVTFLCIVWPPLSSMSHTTLAAAHPHKLSSGQQHVRTRRLHIVQPCRACFTFAGTTPLKGSACCSTKAWEPLCTPPTSDKKRKSTRYDVDTTSGADALAAINNEGVLVKKVKMEPGLVSRQDRGLCQDRARPVARQDRTRLRQDGARCDCCSSGTTCCTPRRPKRVCAAPRQAQAGGARDSH